MATYREIRTHREVRRPQISARHLADYMAASETVKRSIVRGCKYQPIARVIQHDEAKVAVSRFIRTGDAEALREEARQLRDRLTDSDFERDLYDHNADYIERFMSVADGLELPGGAEILAPGRAAPLELNGVRITVDIQFRLRRITRTNKVRVGAGMLRYAKGKALSPEVGAWQSAFLFGYLNAIGAEPGSDPERRLCVTIDAYTGAVYDAPGDSARRFANMDAACASIAERWDNIAPPANAVLD